MTFLVLVVILNTVQGQVEAHPKILYMNLWPRSFHLCHVRHIFHFSSTHSWTILYNVACTDPR